MKSRARVSRSRSPRSDADNNPVSNFQGTVQLTSNDPELSTPLSYTFSGTNTGTYTFSSLSLRRAGSWTITATQTSTGAPLSGSASVTIVPAQAATLDISYPATTRSGVEQSVTIAAEDAFGNAVTSPSGPVTVASTDSQAQFPDGTTVNLVNGQGSIPVILETAGTWALSASGQGLNGSEPVQVDPGSPASLVISGPSDSITAGMPQTYGVLFKDKAGNLATNFTGQVQVTTSDGQASLQSGSTVAVVNGYASFPVTLKTAGTQTVTVQLASPSLTTSVQTVVSAAEPAQFHVSGVPTTISAASTFYATITAYDAYNNLITSDVDSVTLSSDDPKASLPGTSVDLPGGTGTFPVALETAGADDLVASSATASGESAGILVTPLAPAYLTISSGHSGVEAGASYAFSVTAYDEYGNVATGFTGPVSFGSSDPAAELPSGSAAVLNMGEGTFSAVLKTAGPQTISASILGATISGTSDLIQVVNTTAVALTINGLSGTIFAGATTPFVVAAVNQYGVPVPDYTGTVQLTSPDRSVTISPSTYTFTSQDAGQHKFTAVFRFLSTTLTVSDGVLPAVTADVNVTPATAQGGPFQVDTTSTDSDFTATGSVATDDAGGAVAVWTGLLSPPYGFVDVFAQIYAPGGAAGWPTDPG